MPYTTDPPTVAAIAEPRSAKTAMIRGLTGRCPHCGQGRLFQRFTTVVDHCAACGEDFTHQRADDAPPYVVIVIVGHLIVGAALWLEKGYGPPLWLHMLLWLPLTLLLSLALLPPVKGAIIGLQWAARMHGFGEHHE